MYFWFSAKVAACSWSGILKLHSQTTPVQRRGAINHESLCQELIREDRFHNRPRLTTFGKPLGSLFESRRCTDDVLGRRLRGVPGGHNAPADGGNSRLTVGATASSSLLS
ncbi:hypothetical protein MTO96_019859 [Rhipicephalus appendiculatus]